VKKLFSVWLIVVVLFVLGGPIYAQDKQDNDYSSEVEEGEEYLPSIMTTLSADERFSIFVEAIETAGLSEMLEEDGLLTVFAPTDSAFGIIPDDELDKLLADRKALKEIVSGHIGDDELWTSDLAEVDSIETINNKLLSITKADKQTMVNGIPIIEPDIECYNGVIQVIGSVLLPAPGD
jgi:transforming growth factor-beta-induced protein